jgi:hypothetical protein
MQLEKKTHQTIAGAKQLREMTHLFRKIVVIQIKSSEALRKLVRFNKSDDNVMKVAKWRFPQVLVAHFGFCYEWPHDFNGLGNERLDVSHA